MATLGSSGTASGSVLPPRNREGAGCWGRWAATFPGCARLTLSTTGSGSGDPLARQGGRPYGIDPLKRANLRKRLRDDRQQVSPRSLVLKIRGNPVRKLGVWSDPSWRYWASG